MPQGIYKRSDNHRKKISETAKRNWSLGLVKRKISPYTKDNPNICISHGSSGDRRICYWSENGKQKHEYYSRWLWEKTREDIPKNCVIHHIDGNQLNDFIENYDLVTYKQHAKIHNSKPDEYKVFCKFLWQHNHKDNYKKDKYLLWWYSLIGNTDGEKIVNLIKLLNITIERFCNTAKIDSGLVSKIIKGDRNIGKRNIIRIHNILDDKHNYMQICKLCGKSFLYYRIKKFCSPKCAELSTKNKLSKTLVDKNEEL
jgi:transcriptional regulator with XRE-family HTH domain